MEWTRVAMGLVWMTVGCEGTTPPDAPVDVGADTTRPDTPPVMRSALDLTILRIEDGPDVRVPDAIVTLDQAGMPRREERSNTDGRAIFDLVDWSAGPVDVTVYVSGCLLESRIGYLANDFREDVIDTRAVIRVTPMRRDGIQVTGTVTGMLDPVGNHLSIEPTSAWSGHFDGVGPSYSLYTSGALPFALIAREYRLEEYVPGSFRMTVVQTALAPLHSPTGFDERIDIDFASMALPPTIVSGTLTLPDTPFFRSPDAYVYMDERDDSATAVLGAPASVVVSAGVVSYQIGTLSIPGVTGGVTFVSVDDDVRTARTYAPGRALAGPQTFTLLTPPEWGETGLVTVDTPIPVIGATPDAHTTLAIVSDLGTTWRIFAAHGADTIRIPRLPDAAASSIYTPTGARATLGLCGGVRPEIANCWRSAYTTTRALSL